MPMVARMLPQRLWVISSVGRASRLHREGRRFDPVTAHHFLEGSQFWFALGEANIIWPEA